MRPSPRKSLGQHFLLNPSSIDKILDLARIGKEDSVLEIGPGPGSMTERLAARAGHVIAVEKDRRFAELLRQKFQDDSRVHVLEADFLSQDLPQLLGGDTKWKVVANLPYNVATEILFHLLEFSTFFESFHLMFQKEVAERIVARPGSKDYGILSVFSQLFSENRIVMKLKPGSFTPPPKVDSAVVQFRIAEGSRFPIHHLPTFETIVRSAFGQRRKMIRNTLKDALPEISEERLVRGLEEAGIPGTTRAETVPIEKFAKLANALTLV